MPQCTHCQETVTADAERCPHCGGFLADASQLNAESLESAIRLLLSQGEKIKAIKLYREQTGAGLAAAKNAVELIEKGERFPDSQAASYAGADTDDLETQVLELMELGQKIPAIKLYRERTGAGLKEAKDAVEDLAARHGIVATMKTGCFGVL